MGAGSSSPQANLFCCILISKVEEIEVMHHRQVANRILKIFPSNFTLLKI
jgi:hypothetical protein